MFSWGGDAPAIITNPRGDEMTIQQITAAAFALASGASMSPRLVRLVSRAIETFADADTPVPSSLLVSIAGAVGMLTMSEAARVWACKMCFVRGGRVLGRCAGLLSGGLPVLVGVCESAGEELESAAVEAALVGVGEVKGTGVEGIRMVRVLEGLGMQAGEGGIGVEGVCWVIGKDRGALLELGVAAARAMSVDARKDRNKDENEPSTPPFLLYALVLSLESRVVQNIRQLRSARVYLDLDYSSAVNGSWQGVSAVLLDSFAGFDSTSSSSSSTLTASELSFDACVALITLSFLPPSSAASLWGAVLSRLHASHLHPSDAARALDALVSGAMPGSAVLGCVQRLGAGSGEGGVADRISAVLALRAALRCEMAVLGGVLGVAKDLVENAGVVGVARDAVLGSDPARKAAMITWFFDSFADRLRSSPPGRVAKL